MKALVTGATSGIGKAFLKELKDNNIDFAMVGRNEAVLKELKKEYSANYLVVDLSLEKDVIKTYEFGKKEKIDMLINCAGFGYIGEFLDNSIEKDLNMINVNVTAVHLLTKLFLADFKKNDYGYILNVASVAGFFSGPLMATYYATKNYVLKLTTAIYEELRHEKSNVVISALCPGPVDTNFNNVAGGTFMIKGLTKEYVANYALKKFLHKKLIIIPGFKIKLGVFLTRFIPYKLSLKIFYRIEKKKD